jgi:transcription-repair coupling factor (superfamily II helicase)
VTRHLPLSGASDAQAALRQRLGDAFDLEMVERQFGRLGYVLDRVDEPGEAALHGAVLDVYPPIAEPRAASATRHLPPLRH